ncbi:MAG: hypothetical protein ACRERC_12545 [Candidatus Binatia bacterium]
MKHSHILATIACCLALGSAGMAWAGAPQPDQRQGDFEHICQGGPNKGLACTVPTQGVDCPKGACIAKTLSPTIKGVLTLVAHDGVTDWLNGGATNQALTVMLEVKAPDRTRHILAATYQDLAVPTDPPTAPGNVISIPMDELALKSLATALNGLLFVQPESTLSAELQTLFSSTGTPVVIAVDDKRAQSADHTGDGLATVLRFKVKIQFFDPL